MVLLYNLLILLLHLGIKIAAPFHSKAKKFLVGRNNQQPELRKLQTNTSPVVWMHVASLGEYEQGRPVIERIKQLYPQYKIVVSFFSPSGYEHARTDGVVDFKLYLPIDQLKSAQEFVKIINPKLVIFVKYDFWYHHLSVVSQMNIPSILICALFRQNQWYFKWYGAFMKRQIFKFNHIFNIDKQSYRLLEKENYKNISVVGDTRIDRVIQNSKETINLSSIENCFEGPIQLVCGSTWSPDVKVLAGLINKNQLNVVIAPHEIKEEYLKEIETLFEGNCLRYSRIEQFKNDDEPIKILVIDEIGLLSKLYRLGQVAYVGGGFGSGIHNILEAAVYQIPVLFGPNYQKFIEAKEVIELGVGSSISDEPTLQNAYKEMISKKPLISDQLLKYFENSQGASKKIINYLEDIKFIY